MKLYCCNCYVFVVFSRLPVSYSWALSEQSSLQHVPSESLAAVTFPDQPVPLINEVFDVIPIKGRLLPGASDHIEFVFFGFPDLVAKALALCEVEGGPVYDVQLIGCAAQPGYQISNTDIDYGFQRLGELATHQVIITNSGSVDFDWDVNLSRVPSHELSMLRISPSSGIIKAGSSAKLDIQLLAILPTNIYIQVVLRLGHFDPVIINIRSSISFPQIVAWLPRSDDSSFDAFLTQARAYVIDNPILLAQSIEKRPSSRVSVYQADKATFSVPSVPQVLFLYNIQLIYLCNKQK